MIAQDQAARCYIFLRPSPGHEMGHSKDVPISPRVLNCAISQLRTTRFPEFRTT